MLVCRGIPIPPLSWTAEEAQAMDRWLVDEKGRTIESLMALAGLRVAEQARDLIVQKGLRRVLILAGPGNNGGDAVVAGEHLKEGFDVTVIRPLKGETMVDINGEDLIIDGLFGVGLDRPIESPVREAVLAVNGSEATVLSVDLPSGLCATTGEVVGEERGGVGVVADQTVTFVGPKTGFFKEEGPRRVGDWIAVDIGFPPEEAEAWLEQRRAEQGDRVL
ncbi:MAG: NAD(P)H-hydrate epimerase [Planctomycetota bacterium]|nr:NAD(P)H-hydrate epimerase [Planctomycetota bacterium]